jgi:Major Facilitator Superfamily
MLNKLKVSPPLEVRDFRIVLAGAAVSVVGDGMTLVAIVFAVLDVTGSADDAGFVLAAGIVAQAVLLLVGGALADRWPRGRVMALSQLASGSCTGLLAALLILGEARLWMIIVTWAGLGAAQGAFRPASTGIVPELVRNDDLTAANGLVSIARGGGTILGPTLGGLVIALGNPGIAIGIDAVSFIISGVLLLMIRSAQVRARADRHSMLADIAEGWTVVRSRSWLWGSIVYFSFFQFAIMGGLGVLGPLIARSRLGGADVWGAMLSAMGAGALIGGALALRWRPRRLLVGSFLSILGVVPVVIALSVAAPEGWEIGGMLLYGAATTYTDALWFASIQANVPIGQVSRVSSFDWLGSTALYPLGLVIAPPIAALVGTENVLRAIAVIVAVGVVPLLCTPSIRRIGIPEKADVEVLPVPVVEPIGVGES